MQRIANHTQELLAATAGGGVTIGWLAQVNQYLQAVAFLVAIVSGGIVIYRHFRGKKHADSTNTKR